MFYLHGSWACAHLYHPLERLTIDRIDWYNKKGMDNIIKDVEERSTYANEEWTDNSPAGLPEVARLKPNHSLDISTKS